MIIKDFVEFTLKFALLDHTHFKVKFNCDLIAPIMPLGFRPNRFKADGRASHRPEPFSEVTLCPNPK